MYEPTPEFGLLYDAVPLYRARADIAFYVEEVRRTGGHGRVLEIGCGTGRILLPIARAGHAITGVDPSPAMLARLREKLAGEAADVQRRVTIIESDARSMRPAATFNLAIAPFRVFMHLETTDEQLAVLARVRELIAPSGRLVFDLFNPKYSLMVQDRTAETEDTPETPMADGRFLRRSSRVTRVRWHEQISEVELIYHVRDPRTTRTERHVQQLRMRWYNPAELEHLLWRAGFRIDTMYGSLDRQPLADDSAEIIVVARVA